MRESADELKQRLKQERHPLKQQHLPDLYLVASGQVTQRLTVATLLGVSRNVVGRWLDQYEQGELEALLSVKPRPGKVPMLTPLQVAALRDALARPEGSASYIEVQQWIAEQLGVECSSVIKLETGE